MEDTILLSFPLALTRVWINPAMHSGEPRAGDTRLMSPCYCCSSGWRKIPGQSAWTWLTDTSSNLANLSFGSSFCVLFTTLPCEKWEEFRKHSIWAWTLPNTAVSEYLHLRRSEVESLIVYKETSVWPEGWGVGGLTWWRIYLKGPT